MIYVCGVHWNRMEDIDRKENKAWLSLNGPSWVCRVWFGLGYSCLSCFFLFRIWLPITKTIFVWGRIVFCLYFLSKGSIVKPTGKVWRQLLLPYHTDGIKSVRYICLGLFNFQDAFGSQRYCTLLLLRCREKGKIWLYTIAMHKRCGKGTVLIRPSHVYAQARAQRSRCRSWYSVHEVETGERSFTVYFFFILTPAFHHCADDRWKSQTAVNWTLRPTNHS